MVIQARAVVQNIHNQLPTDRQADVFDVVSRVTKRKGVAPSMREIADTFGVAIHAVDCHLKCLRRKGYLTWAPTTSRSIVVTRGIPVLGEVG